MINNSPQIRNIIYWVGIVIGALTVVFQSIPADWARLIADGLERLAAYFTVLLGVTATTNLTQGGDVKLLESKTTITQTSSLDD